MTQNSREPRLETNEYGTKRWFLDGKLHREGGLAAVEWPNGDKEWWFEGQLHREAGPAIENASGYKSWWINGKRHREDGPAVEYDGEDKTWYLDGEECTQEQIDILILANFGAKANE